MGYDTVPFILWAARCWVLVSVVTPAAAVTYGRSARQPSFKTCKRDNRRQETCSFEAGEQGRRNSVDYFPFIDISAQVVDWKCW